MDTIEVTLNRPVQYRGRNGNFNTKKLWLQATRGKLKGDNGPEDVTSNVLTLRPINANGGLAQAAINVPLEDLDDFIRGIYKATAKPSLLSRPPSDAYVLGLLRDMKRDVERNWVLRHPEIKDYQLLEALSELVEGFETRLIAAGKTVPGED